MFDGAGRMIYVGQSMNLRKRLGSYRSVHPARDSRKTIRLVHAVERIEWEVCADHASARLLENELLRAHRPRFNRVNTYPKAYSFFAVGLTDDALSLRRAHPAGPGLEQFGAFKGPAIPAFGSLLRLLWGALHPAASVLDLPRELCQPRPPPDYAFPVATHDRQKLEVIRAELGEFLRGASDGLIGWIKAQLPSGPDVPVFHQTFQAHDLEVLETFFQAGPRRNALYRERHRLDGHVIEAEMLDDLAVLYPAPRSAAGSTAGPEGTPAPRSSLICATEAVPVVPT